MKTLLFIYNPAAGKAKITSALGEVTALFQKEDWLVTLYATKAAGDATKAVQELGSSYDRIICSGGDGTLSEVVTGLIHGGLKQPLGRQHQRFFQDPPPPCQPLQGSGHCGSRGTLCL